jgi:biotin carboxyl carrier protein
VRVDACGYVGYAPPSQFDPLLAKVICSANSPSVAAAVDRTRRALDEFHIAGLPTNVHQLLAILAHADVRAGDARTSLLVEAPELMAAASAGVTQHGTLALLAQQAGSVGAGPSSDARALADLDVGHGQQAVRSPMDSTVAEVRVREGDVVEAGQTVMVLSAMKMETQVVAPCAGVVVAVQHLKLGDKVTRDQVVAVVAPAAGDTSAIASPRAEDTWAPVLDDVGALQRLAAARLAPGSDDPGVVRQRSRGKLTCRERIALLLDAGSFREVGSLTGFASYDEDGHVVAFTPANHVGGWGVRLSSGDFIAWRAPR